MDTDNNCVRLLDMDCIFIAYVEHLKIRGISAMSLDENERLWIANNELQRRTNISSEYKISIVILSEIIFKAQERPIAFRR